MSDRLFDDGPAISEKRADALASVIAGFVAPGLKNWASVPKAVKEPCREAAHRALAFAAERVPSKYQKGGAAE